MVTPQLHHGVERVRGAGCQIGTVGLLSRGEGSDAKRPSASCRVRDGSRVASTSSTPQTDRNVCVTGLRVRALVSCRTETGGFSRLG
jgi:hypothetical protein